MSSRSVLIGTMNTASARWRIACVRLGELRQGGGEAQRSVGARPVA